MFVVQYERTISAEYCDYKSINQSIMYKTSKWVLSYVISYLLTTELIISTTKVKSDQPTIWYISLWVIATEYLICGMQ